MIYDTSGSMLITEASTGQQRRVGASQAAINFINSAQNINFGLMSFAPVRNSTNLNFDVAVRDINQIRTDAVTAIQNYVYDAWTPLYESYFEAYRYFRGENSRFAVTFGANTRVAGSTSQYRSPITHRCQENIILLITDGLPSVYRTGLDLIRNLISGVTFPTGEGLTNNCDTSDDASDNEWCMEELGYFMDTTDMSSTIDGTQHVSTFVVACYGDADETVWRNTARVSGGEYYSVANSNELAAALTGILERVNATASIFAAPATSPSAFNSLQTSEDVYYTMFRPARGPNWTGNLKRYRLGQDNQIYDVNGNLAIDATTGQFRATAQSFWSSSADGLIVGAGGVAEEITLTRALYTNTTGSTDVDLTDSDNILHENTTAITSAMLGAADATERTQLLQWGRGVDIDDSDGDGSTTDVRTAVGDALHTQPRDITYYADSTGSVVDKTVFFTTNDGFLHAIDADDGTTEFAFIPEELLSNLKFYRDGFVSGGTLKVYGMDGPMTVWHNDANNDGDVLQADNGSADANEHIYLYLTMRRGGNNIYALDVTDRSNPELKWVIEGDLDNDHQRDTRTANPNFNELGQTWSAPLLARVNWNGAERQVLLFGGGYDADTDAQTTIASNSDIGNAIYMVDAETGAKLWSASSQSYSNLTLSTMDFGIAADLTLVDIDQDGLIDFFFAADTGGQLFRFDIDPANSGASNFATGGKIAQISTSTAANTRRFFEAPVVSIGRNSEYLNIAVGTGLRHSPLDTTVNDRMYVIRDPNVFETPANYNYATRGGSSTFIDESNLYDATSNLIQQGTTAEQQTALTTLDSSNGWYLRMESSGEKILGQATIFNGILLFNSFTPVATFSSNCIPQAGTNHFYSVNIENAGSVFNQDTSVAALNKSDRRVATLNSAIAPTPSIVNRGNQGSEVCVGTQCFQNLLRSVRSVPMHRNFWRENR